MATNTVPRFTERGVIGKVAISTANANRDGTGTIGTVLTAGANGTLVESIRVEATGTTTAGMVRIFLHDGSAYFLYCELLVAAITPSATVSTFVTEYIPIGSLVMPSGWSLRASTEKAEAFNVFAFGGDY